MKKYLIAIFLFLLFPSVSNALICLPVNQGGSGVCTITGIIQGNGTSPFSTVTVGSGLSYSGGILSSTVTGNITGTGSSGQVTYWNGTSSVAGNNNFTWNNGTSILKVNNVYFDNNTIYAQSGDLNIQGYDSLHLGTVAYPYAINVDNSGLIFGLQDIYFNQFLTTPGLLSVDSNAKLELFTGSIPVVNGGTGLSSYAIGDIIYASGTSTLSKLADVATGNSLISGGVGVAPSWGKIGLTTHVTGTLPIANGGTGQTTANTAFNALVPSQTSNSGKYLTTDGTNTSWATVISGVSSVFGRTGAVVAVSGDYNTSQVTENTNLYFTNARAIASTLTGYTSGAGTISSSDSILQAIQKLNGNTAALVTGVSSVSNSDGTLTISPTTGAVVASIALGHANTWTATQKFTALTAFGAATPSYWIDVLDNVTAQTASNRAVNVSTAGATYNTTAGALTSYAGYYSNTATRSAGANALTNVGMYLNVGGAQNNYALLIDGGNVGIGTMVPIPVTSTRKALIVSDTTNNATIEVWGTSAGKAQLESVLGDTYVGNAAGTTPGNLFLTYGAGTVGTSLIASTGNFGINTGTTVSAKLHVISTTEQFRSGYDTSNYWNAITGSTGITTFDAVGSGHAFAFSDPVTITGAGTITGTTTLATSLTGTLQATSGVVSVNTTLTNTTSGTYTPTATNVTNITSSTPIVTHYIRVGNEVTVSGSITITNTLAVASEVDVSLPVASNLAAATDLSGTATMDSTASVNMYIKGDATNDRASIFFTSAGVGQTSTIYYQFSYKVI